MIDEKKGPRSGRALPLVFAIALITAPALRAEDPSPPPVPSPKPPPDAPARSKEEILEERLRTLEERYERMERRHDEEYRALATKYEASRNKEGAAEAPREPQSPGTGGRRSEGGVGAQGTSGRAAPRESGGGAPGRNTPGGGTPGRNTPGGGTPGRNTPGGGTPNRNIPGGGTQRERGGIGAQGTDARTFVREYDVGPDKRPGKVTFSEGLEFASEDDEFRLTFHDLTQAEYRGFPSYDRGTLQSQFFVPRQRWYFTGQVTKAVEFYTVINRGYGSLDLLDAFMTLNLVESLTPPAPGAEDPTGAEGEGGRVTANRGRGSDNRLRFRVGRMKTPYLYEYYSIAEGDLIAPERSIYAGNFAGNRQDGAMFLGELFGQKLGYAAGIFNGPRRSFQDFNSDKDLFLYLNTRPFLDNEDLPWLNYLNIGSSLNGGRENNPLQPSALHTANDQSSASSASTANSLSPTFLTFNSNVVELGNRNSWAGHVAYFYESLMLLGEVAGGSQGYALNKSSNSTQIPYHGWMFQGTYFLTGEKLTRRVNVVRPLKRFGYYKGQFGLGAIEVHGRFSEMDLSSRVFTAGFADPNQWSNRAYATDIGLNWYWNFYTKIYFDWQHGVFGNPVAVGPSGRFAKQSDLYWLRFQLFF